MKANETKVDPLSVIEQAFTFCAGQNSGPSQDDMRQARAAVAALIEAAMRANGDHTAPHDCYATGPVTGNPIADFVSCPGCELAAALARIGGAA